MTVRGPRGILTRLNYSVLVPPWRSYKIVKENTGQNQSILFFVFFYSKLNTAYEHAVIRI